jgi:tetratricopeptide (TPR) repeat protein
MRKLQDGKTLNQHQGKMIGAFRQRFEEALQKLPSLDDLHNTERHRVLARGVQLLPKLRGEKELLEERGKIIETFVKTLEHSSPFAALRSEADPLTEKLRSFQEVRDTLEKLVHASPTAIAYRIDLAASYHNVANLHAQSGRPDEAMVSFQQARDILNHLIHDHPGVKKFQNDLAQNHLARGIIQTQSGQLSEALSLHEQSRDIWEQLIQASHEDMKLKSSLAGVYGNIAYIELLNRRSKESIAAALNGVKIDPNQLQIVLNLATGYFFDNQFEKAKELYMRYKDFPIKGEETFAAKVSSDFRALREKGLTHPDMAKIEQSLLGRQ